MYLVVLPTNSKGTVHFFIQQWGMIPFENIVHFTGHGDVLCLRSGVGRTMLETLCRPLYGLGEHNY